MVKINNQENSAQEAVKKAQILLEKGVAYHQLNRIDEAIVYYKKALEIQPNQPFALNNMGFALSNKGRLDEALAYCKKAIIIRPEFAEAYNNIGNIYSSLGRLDDGVNNLQKAIRLNPSFAEAHNNYGNIKLKQDKLDEAVIAYQNAIAINPGYVMAYNNLGNAIKKQDKIDEAIACYQKAISIEPNFHDSHYNLGVILHEQDKNAEAILCLQNAISLKPDFVAAHCNLGGVFHEQNKLDEAVICFNNAIAIDPNYAMAYSNLGNTLKEQAKLDESIINCQKAISINPNYAEAHHNLGNTLLVLGKPDDAMKSYQKAIKLNPKKLDFQYSIGYIHLLKGELIAGWKNYNLRWYCKQLNYMRVLNNEKQLWRGEPLEGKRLLVLDEQGVGENILFSSMLPDLISKGADIVLECDERLIPLITRSFPTVACKPNTDSLSEYSINSGFDFFVPSGNLGSLLRQNINSFPNKNWYLLPNVEQKEIIRNRYLDTNENKLIGISWNSKSYKYKNKSIKLIDLKPLFVIPGVTFVDLQYGDTKKEREEFSKKTGYEFINDKNIDQKEDLDSFAAQVAAMDLVVTISNTTAHMAGALGVPTLLMLGKSPIWYWMLDKTDSLWYPSIRSFRQKKIGEWEDVIEQVSKVAKQLTIK
ncbi:MAG: tetratricopeptide repeat protein [Magnetococcales bacterium]|nr:tetratricopeptide repeat protein [Magnetococcales bacterium]